MAKPVSFLAESTIDYDSEISGWEVPVITLTAGNLTAQTALHDALIAAIATIKLTTTTKTTTIAERVGIGATPPTNKFAQRETKWLIRFHDAVTLDKFTVSIPGADLALLGPASKFMDITLGAFTALKSAFEAVVRSPNDGANAVILDNVQQVGRNL